MTGGGDLVAELTSELGYVDLKTQCMLTDNKLVLSDMKAFLGEEQEVTQRIFDNAQADLPSLCPYMEV